MKVVDSSAIVAVLLNESRASEMAQKLSKSQCLMAAPIRVELAMVIESRSGPRGTLLLDELLNRVDMQIVPVDETLAKEAIIAWRRFGKGRHRARLNFGDTFSYALARSRGLPLLFVGDDFGHTDVLVA